MVSLNLRMLAVLLLGACLAWGLNRGILWLGNSLIDRVYMTPARQYQRQEDLVRRLTDYVRQNNVASDDATALSAWCRDVRHVYLSIYKDGNEVLGTDGAYVVETYLETYTDNELLNYAQQEAARTAQNTQPDAGADGYQPPTSDEEVTWELYVPAEQEDQVTQEQKGQGRGAPSADGDDAAPGERTLTQKATVSDGDSALTQEKTLPAEDTTPTQEETISAGDDALTQEKTVPAEDITLTQEETITAEDGASAEQPEVLTEGVTAHAAPLEGDADFDGEVIYNDATGEYVADLATGEMLPVNILYQVPFADGDSMVSLVDYSEMGYYNLVQTVSLAVAVVVLLGALLAYTSSLTRRVTTMSRMVARVADGDLEAPIVPHGRDELYLLATDVEAMRNAIVQRLHGEQQAWQANNQLITAISHDIRNPLTSLIGYTDLLAGGQVDDPDLQRQYIATCRDKAYQLKELTDELFGYFVVFGSPTLKVSVEELDLCILLGQLLGEAVFHLQSQGQQVHYTPLPGDRSATAKVDVLLLKRVIDNLFSNIRKYADPALPVCVRAELQPADAPTGVTITLANGITQKGKRTESNRIGLRTCAKIAQELHIGFTHGPKQGDPTRYVVQLCIPADVLPAPQAPPDAPA